VTVRGTPGFEFAAHDPSEADTDCGTDGDRGTNGTGHADLGEFELSPDSAPALAYAHDDHTVAERVALGRVVDPVAVGSADRASAQARILDRGYRRYTGRQLGTSGAIRTLTSQTILRALGIRRSMWSKVFPIIAVFIAYVPAIVFIGVTVLVKDLPEGRTFLDDPRLLPSYGAYYGFVWAAILVFVAFVAPEVLCTDRRNGMLGLYLASPLNRNSYLVAKAMAVTGILALVTLGPPLLYMLGLTLNERGPDGIDGFVSILGKVLISGLAVAALHVSLSFAVASTTTRRAAASAAIILILLSSAVLVETLVNVARLDSRLLVFNILFLPFELVFRIFGSGHVDRTWIGVPTGEIVGAYLAWTAAFSAFVWNRYRHIQVTR
jgi:ABC-2 type transport system permease protein